MSSVTAEHENPYAALYNPALIPSQNLSLFSFSTSQAKVNYAPIENVDIRGVRRDTTVSSADLTLWALGFTYPFELGPVLNRRAGLGITLSGPFSKIRSFVSHQPDDFYSVRYGASDSQFKGTLALSSEIIREHLYFGVGASLYLSGAGAAEANINQDNPTGRMALDVGLNTAAIVGILQRWDNNSIGLTYHQELDPNFIQTFDGKVNVNGTPFHQPLTVSSSLYYEPNTIELEAQKDFKTFKVSLGVSYQMWNGYRPPVLITQTKDTDGNTHVTQLPPGSYGNTFNPRISVEFPTFERRIFISTGYEYRPTPVSDLSGAGNGLDSDTHIVGLSVQHEVLPSDLFPWPVRWGVFGQYHRLTSRQVEKKEAGSTGAPSYVFSGNAYTYGVSLCVGL